MRNPTPRFFFAEIHAGSFPRLLPSKLNTGQLKTGPLIIPRAAVRDYGDAPPPEPTAGL